LKNSLWLLVFLGAIIFAQAETNFEDFEQEYQRYEQKKDPLFAYNKAMTHFNVALYDYAFKPVLKVYNFVSPSFLRNGVKNFFSNLLAPLRFSSNLLQFKFHNAKEEIQRFSVNTIIGFLGFFDVASAMGLKKHPADFGTLLGHWGIGSGFHIVLPVLGPSNLRDALALGVDWFLTPSSYIKPSWTSFAVNSYGFANELSFHLDELDELYHNNANLYPFLRDAYEQRRMELSK